MSDVAQDINTYFQDIENVRIQYWLATSAATLVFYDWFLCIPQEYKYIWKARWSAGKILYFIHRYPLVLIAILNLHFDEAPHVPISQCRVWVPFDYGVDIFVVAFVQVTLLLRVYALYEKNKKLIFWLSILFCVCIGTTLSLYSLVVRKFFYWPIVKPLTGCLPDCDNCLVFIPMIHVPLLVFDTIVFAFTFAKCFRYYSGKDGVNFPTLAIVFRDGLIYYVVTFAIILFNILFMSFSKAAQTGWFTPIERAVCGIMGTRLLLNLRGQIDQQRDGTAFNLHTVNVESFDQEDEDLDAIDMDVVSPSGRELDSPLSADRSESAMIGEDIVSTWTSRSAFRPSLSGVSPASTATPLSSPRTATSNTALIPYSERTGFR